MRKFLSLLLLVTLNQSVFAEHHHSKEFVNISDVERFPKITDIKNASEDYTVYLDDSSIIYLDNMGEKNAKFISYSTYWKHHKPQVSYKDKADEIFLDYLDSFLMVANCENKDVFLSESRSYDVNGKLVKFSKVDNNEWTRALLYTKGRNELDFVCKYARY